MASSGIEIVKVHSCFYSEKMLLPEPLAL